MLAINKPAFPACGRRLWLAVAFSIAVHALLVGTMQRNATGSGAGGPEQFPIRLDAQLAVSKAPDLPALPPESGGTAIAINARHTTSTTPPQASSLKPATTAASQTKAAAGPYYFPSTELDRKPFPLKRLVVPVPDDYEKPEQASVVLRIRINEGGGVDDARVLMSSGVSAFEEEALKAFRAARFKPGYRQGIAVRSEMTIEVTLYPPDNS